MEADKKKTQRIAIFGAGSYGENAVDYLRNKKKGHADIVALCDNDIRKHGNQLFGIPVLPPIELTTLDCDEIWVASTYAAEIKNQLMTELYIDPCRIHVVPANAVVSKEAMEKLDSASSIFRSVINVLQDNNICWWLDHSSLLGLLRSNDPIALGDIDMCVLAESPISIMKMLQDSLPDIHIEKVLFCHSGISDIWANGEITELKLAGIMDIHFKKLIGDRIEWMVGPMQLAVPSIFYTGNERIDWHDLTLSLPLNPSAYLEALYGNWRTPNGAWTYADYNNIQKIFGGMDT